MWPLPSTIRLRPSTTETCLTWCHEMCIWTCSSSSVVGVLMRQQLGADKKLQQAAMTSHERRHRQSAHPSFGHSAGFVTMNMAWEEESSGREAMGLRSSSSTPTPTGRWTCPDHRSHRAIAMRCWEWRCWRGRVFKDAWIHEWMDWWKWFGYLPSFFRDERFNFVVVCLILSALFFPLCN